MTIDLSLYLVTDSAQSAHAGRSLAHTVQQAVAAGVTVVQVREKDASSRDFLAQVRTIADVLPAHVPLIVNDRIDVFLAARAAGARVAGVHLGQSEVPAELARQLIGADAILGVSAATPETLAEAQHAGVVDYVGIGPLNATTTKRNAPAALGIDKLAQLRALTPLPAVAIGGITAADLGAVRAAGFDGAAVVSAICAAADAHAATLALRDAWHGAAHAG